MNDEQNSGYSLDGYNILEFQAEETKLSRKVLEIPEPEQGQTKHGIKGSQKLSDISHEDVNEATALLIQTQWPDFFSHLKRVLRIFSKEVFSSKKIGCYNAIIAMCICANDDYWL